MKHHKAYRSDEPIDTAVYAWRLETARLIKELTQEELAEKTNMSLEEIVWFETGMMQPDRQQLQLIGWVTGFPVEFFREPPPQGFPEYTTLDLHEEAKS